MKTLEIALCVSLLGILAASFYSNYLNSGNLTPIRAYVINLPERTDRWIAIQSHWAGLVDELIRVDGVRHPHPHNGCGLAHINAMRMGFANKEEVVFVLEDDALPLPGLTADRLRELIQEGRRNFQNFDAIFN